MKTSAAAGAASKAVAQRIGARRMEDSSGERPMQSVAGRARRPADPPKRSPRRPLATRQCLARVLGCGIALERALPGLAGAVGVAARGPRPGLELVCLTRAR